MLVCMYGDNHTGSLCCAAPRCGHSAVVGVMVFVESERYFVASQNQGGHRLLTVAKVKWSVGSMVNRNTKLAMLL